MAASFRSARAAALATGESLSRCTAACASRPSQYEFNVEAVQCLRWQIEPKLSTRGAKRKGHLGPIWFRCVDASRLQQLFVVILTDPSLVCDRLKQQQTMARTKQTARRGSGNAADDTVVQDQSGGQAVVSPYISDSAAAATLPPGAGGPLPLAFPVALLSALMYSSDTSMLPFADAAATWLGKSTSKCGRHARNCR